MLMTTEVFDRHAVPMTSQQNQRSPSARSGGCFRPSTNCGFWLNTNVVIGTVEARCFGVRASTRRRSPNGADNVTKEH